MKVSAEVKSLIHLLKDQQLSNSEIGRKITERYKKPFDHRRVATVLRGSKKRPYKPRNVDNNKWRACREDIKKAYTDNKLLRTQKVIDAVEATHSVKVVGSVN